MSIVANKPKNYIRYFEGFNELRFLAAMLVVLHHAEQIRKTQGLEHLKAYSLFQNGGLAVDFFFVLSGFLITYLLLKERYTSQTISIKKFYTRRILRIWPLYYLLVFLGLAAVPFALSYTNMEYSLPFDATTGWLLYVFFLPNAVSSLYPPTGNLIYPLWSIGVEEQFYIIWAPLFKYLFKYIVYILVGIIIFKFLLNEYLLNLAKADSSWEFWYKFSKTVKFEAMSIGGLGALYLINNGSEKLQNSLIFDKRIQLICFSILLLHFGFRNYIFDLNNSFSAVYSFFFRSKITPLLLSTLFLWLLLNTSINKRAIFSLRNKWLNKLGEVSYGIYMYQIIVIYIVVNLTKKWLPQDIFLSELIFYSLTLSILFSISFISYYYFEKIFLNLKK